MTETGDIRLDRMMPLVHESWPLMPFEECLVPRTVSYRKLKSNDIKETGAIPVIDQGEQFIAGFTDVTANGYSGHLPVIVFGDHTRRFKYIDFKFAIGADGTRLLYPREELHPKFFYYYLCSINLVSEGYSRHYKFLKTVSVPIPPMSEQKRIVARIEKLLSLARKIEARYKEAQQRVGQLPQSILAKAFRGELVSTEYEIAEREGRPFESTEQALLRIRTYSTTSSSSKRKKNSK